ncbi:UvrD-helicase domain-containing protein [Streptomyces sp. NEAU-174]|uniref:UvrD-helicase domain-containing protein n=1 Tax=Streptomyces sp. NEAU-174 TaxID=3458254 RepID=UPI004044EFFE
MYQTPRQLPALDAHAAGEAIVYRASTPPDAGPWQYRLYAIGPHGPEAAVTERGKFLLVRVDENEGVHEVAGPRTLLHQQWGEQLLDRLWEALDNDELPVESADAGALAAAEQGIVADILSGSEPTDEGTPRPARAASSDTSNAPANDQQRSISDVPESAADFAPGDIVWHRDGETSQDGEEEPLEAVFVQLSDESEGALLVQDVDGDDEPYLIHLDMVVARERLTAGSPAGAIRFRPRGQNDLGPSGRVARIRANIAALRVLHTLRDEQRPATAAEQAVLARWSSWGAVPEIFDPRKREFAGLRGELRSLLSEQEWYAAEATTRNAHFTDAALVEPIWQALKDLGFEDGRLLEPGCGSGNFLAFAPDTAQMTGVELDPVTAEIAAALYPDAEIRAESFVDTRYPEGYFDGAIGNVPFDEVALTDPVHNPLRLPTHNHFIVKALEMVRPGGLVAVLTSRFTLDSMGKTSRLEIADRADLVGAVRLPAGAHRRAAGTNAVSDLLILRRRDDQALDIVPEWLGLAPVQVDAETNVMVNRYFARHRERVLGKISVINTQYGHKDITVHPDADTPLPEALSDALATITRQARESGLTMSASPDALQRAEVERRAERMRRAEEMFGEELSRFEGTLLDQEDGTFLQLVGGELVERPLFKNSVEELRSLLRLRDTYVALLSVESSGDGERATALRQQLNERYDAHVGSYDFLNRRDTRRDRRSAHGCFRTDPYAAGVYALEIYDKEAGTAKKSPIFTRAVSSPKSEQRTADTPQDALAISLNTYGKVQISEIASLLGIDSLDETRDVLGELVYNEPGTQRLVPAAEYLSGNVRQKIQQVENVLQMVSDDSRSQHPFQRNLAALRRVLPPDKQPGDIEDIQFGATWIKPKFYEQFLRQLLQTTYLTVTRVSGADWEVEAPSNVRKSRAATKVYGTPKRNAIDLAQRMLRRASLVVHPPRLDEDAAAQDILDAKRWAAEQTEQTIAKSDEINRLFADWLWQDPERSVECLADYNRLYNSYVAYEGDGSHLTFPGLSDVITPRPHQRAGVARALSEPGGSFFDYEVGFGKTLTIAMTLMEMKRLRMVNKPCVVVKNATVNDFRNDFLKAYPGARVLAIDSSEFTKDTAAAYIAQIANGDWDAVILPQSLFKRIPMSGRGQEQFVADQTAEYRARIHQVLTGSDEALSPELNPGGDPLVSEALDTVAALGGTSGAAPTKDTVKKMQGDLKRHTQRAEKNLVKQTTSGISWEQTGIDFIAVDEVQDFANGEVGANNSELALPVSAQAKDLKVKIRTMEKAYGPKVALGSTGTPFPNAMPQAFVMLDYFRRDLLVAAEIDAFSSFQAQYLMDRVSPEISPEGIPRMKERIGAFRNSRSFHVLWKTMADVKTKHDIQLPVPKHVSTTEVVAATNADREYMEDIAFRAEVVRAGEVDASVDNLLKISNDGRLAAMDLRMVGSTPDGPGKIEAAADRIFQIYQEYKDRAYTDREGAPSALPGALQLVFADRGTPSDENRKAGKFIAYDYLKDQLVERGIPAGQIRFSQEAKNAEEKEALWSACRRGQVAVVIGSTDTMGVGVNVQDRAIALHHLDCPWRPSDVTQREGRIVRQFNQHFDQKIPVQVIRWVKEGSFDSFMWQTVERKARFIDQVRTGRDLEEQDQALDGDLGKDYLEFGEIKAIATGNPLLLKKMQAEEEVRQLEAAYTNWKRTNQHLRNVVDTGDETLAKAQENADLVGRAAGAYTETKGDSFRMELPNGKTVTKRQDAATALRTQLALMHRQMRGADASSWEHMATLGGQEFHARIDAFNDYIGFSIRGLRDVSQATFTVSDVNAVLSDGKPPLGLITRMENQAEKLDGLHATLLAVVDELKQEIDRAQKLVDQPFAKADKLRRARADLLQLEAEIDTQAGAGRDDQTEDETSSGTGRQDSGAAEADELIQVFQDWRGAPTFVTWRFEASRSGNSSAEDSQRSLVEAAGDALIEEIRQQRQAAAAEGRTPDFRALEQCQALLEAASAYLDVLGSLSDDDLQHDAQEVTRELIYGVRDYLAQADRAPTASDTPAAAENTPHPAEPVPSPSLAEREPPPAAGRPVTVGAGPHRRAAEPYADRTESWAAEQSTLDTYRAWAEEFGSRLDEDSPQGQALARAARQVFSESSQTRQSRLLGFATFVNWEAGQALADAARAIADQWDREQQGHAAVSRTWEMHAAVRDHFARYRATTEDPQSTTFLQWAGTDEPITLDDEEALEFIPGLSLFDEYTVTGPDGMRTDPATGADLAAGIAQLLAEGVVVEEAHDGLTLTATNGTRFDITPSTLPTLMQDSDDGPGLRPGEDDDSLLEQLIAQDMAAMAGAGWTEIVHPFGSQQEAIAERDRVEAAYEQWAATQTALPMLVDAQEELAGEELGVTNPAGYVASWHHRSRMAATAAGPTGGRMVVEQFEGLAQAARRADSHLAEQGAYDSEADRALLIQVADSAARYAQRLAATLDVLAEQRAQDDPTQARMHEVRALESAIEYLTDEGDTFRMNRRRSSYTDREAAGTRMRQELLDALREFAELPPERQNLDTDARVLYGHIRGIPLYVGWRDLGGPQARAVLGFDQLSLLEHDSFTAAELETLTPSQLIYRIDGRLALDALAAIRDRELKAIQALLVAEAEGETGAGSTEAQTEQQPGADFEASADGRGAPAPAAPEESGTPLQVSEEQRTSLKPVHQETPGTTRIQAQKLSVLLGFYTDPGELVAGRELIRETVVQFQEVAKQRTENTPQGPHLAGLVAEVSEASYALDAAPQVSPADIFPLYDRLAAAASSLADETDGDLAQKAHTLLQRTERHLGRMHATGRDLFDVLLDASALDTGSWPVLARNDPLKERPTPYTDNSHLNFARQIIFETYDRWPQVYSSTGGEFSDLLRGAMWEIRQTSDTAVGTALPDWMNVVSYALAAAEEADEGVSRSVLRDVAQRAYQHHQSLASFQLAAERSEPYGAERSYTDGTGTVAGAWDAWMATGTAADLARREMADPSADAPQSHQRHAQEEMREALYAADWAQTDDGTLDEVTRRATKAAHAAYALVLCLREGSYRNREDANVLTRLVRTCYEHAAACRVFDPDAISAVRGQLAERQDQLRAMRPDGTQTTTKTEPSAARASDAALLEIEHHYRGTVVRRVTNEASDTPVRGALERHGFKLSKDQTFWYLPRRLLLTNRDVHLRKLTDDLTRLGRRYEVDDEPPQQPQPEITIPIGEPYISKTEASQDFEEISAALWRMQDTPAGRRLITRGRDARPDGAAVWLAMEELRQGPVGSNRDPFVHPAEDVVSRCTTLAQAALTLAHNLEEERYRAPVALPHFRTVTQYATLLASRVTATAAQEGLWEELFATPGTETATPGTEADVTPTVSDTATTTGTEKNAPESAGANEPQAASDLIEPGPAVDPLTAGPYGDEELRAAVDHLQYLYQQAAQALPTWHRPDGPPGPSGDVEAWYRGPGKIEVPEGFVPYTNDGAALKVGDVIREGHPRWLESKKLSYKTVVITSGRDHGDGYYRADPNTRVHPREIVAVPADSRLLAGAEEDRYTIRGTFWDRWKTAEVAGDASIRGELPLPATIDAYRQAVIATSALAHILDQTAVPYEAEALLTRLSEATEHHIVRLTLTHRIADERAESKQQRQQEHEPQQANDDERPSPTERAQKRAEVEAMINENLARTHGIARERAVQVALADPYVQSIFEGASKEEMRPRFREWLRVRNIPDSDGTEGRFQDWYRDSGPDAEDTGAAEVFEQVYAELSAAAGHASNQSIAAAPQNETPDASTQPQFDQPAALSAEQNVLFDTLDGADAQTAAAAPAEAHAPSASSDPMGTPLAEEHLQFLPHRPEPRREDDARLAVVTTLNLPDGQVRDVLLLLQAVEVAPDTGDGPIVRGAQIVPANALISTSLNGRWLPADLLAMADARVLPLAAPIPWPEVEQLATLPAHRARLALPLGTSATDSTDAASTARTERQAPRQAAEPTQAPEQGDALRQQFDGLAGRLIVGHIGAGMPTEHPSASPTPHTAAPDGEAPQAETTAADQQAAIGPRQEEAPEPPPTSEPASKPQQQEESVTVTEPEPTQGPWTSRIKIIMESGATFVTGTGGDFWTQERDLRELLKKNRNFAFRGGRWRYQGRAANRERVLDEVRAFLAAKDAQEAAAAPAPYKELPPTEQQQRIIDAFMAGQDIVVQALAGTGKTSTLQMLTRRTPEQRFAYVAFNSSIAAEAKRKFPNNVTARTSHSFARTAMQNTPLRKKIETAGRNGGARRPKDVAAALGITEPFVVARVKGQTQHMGAEDVARVVTGAIRRFRESADAELAPQHLGEKWANSPAAAALLDVARRAWADIKDPNSDKLFFSHDDYLKLWALTNPRLNYDVILFDEAQDINAVLKKVIQDQSAQTIVVGDSNQQIYEFRGAIDALKGWPADIVLPLTQSWRFGPEVAEVGNAYLKMLGSDLLLEGNPNRDTALGPVEEPDAVLCRTNVGAISAVFAGFEAGKRVALVGGGRDIEDIAKAAQDLLRGRRTKHPELANFETWREVREYAETDEEAKTLQMFVRLVDRYSPEGLLGMIGDLVPEDARDEETRPELVVSTAHKAKGREWDLVRIGADFPQPKENTETGELDLPSAEELRLAYVALTRAKQRLETGSLGWIYDIADMSPRHTNQTAITAQVEQQTTTETEPVPEPEPTNKTPTAAEATEDERTAIIHEGSESRTATQAEIAQSLGDMTSADGTSYLDLFNESLAEGRTGGTSQAEDLTADEPLPRDPKELEERVSADYAAMAAGPRSADTGGDGSGEAEHSDAELASAAQAAQVAPLPWDEDKIRKRTQAGTRRSASNGIPNLARDISQAVGDNQARAVWEQDHPFAQYETNLHHTLAAFDAQDTATRSLVEEVATQLQNQIGRIASRAAEHYNSLIAPNGGDPILLAALDEQLTADNRLPELNNPLVREALILVLRTIDESERTARSRKLKPTAVRNALDQVVGLAGSTSVDGELFPHLDAALAPVKVQLDTARERMAEMGLNATVLDKYTHLRRLITTHQEQAAQDAGQAEGSSDATEHDGTSAAENEQEQQKTPPGPLTDRDIAAGLSRISNWDFGQLILDMDRDKRRFPEVQDGYFRLPVGPGNEEGRDRGSAYSSRAGLDIEIKDVSDTRLRAGRVTWNKALAWIAPALTPLRRALVTETWRTSNLLERTKDAFLATGEYGRYAAVHQEVRDLLGFMKETITTESLEAHLTGRVENLKAKNRLSAQETGDSLISVDELADPESARVRAAEEAALERVRQMQAVMPERHTGMKPLREVKPGDAFWQVSPQNLPFVVRQRPVAQGDQVIIEGDLVTGAGQFVPYTWTRRENSLDDVCQPLLLPQSLADLVDLPADGPDPAQPSLAETRMEAQRKAVEAAPPTPNAGRQETSERLAGPTTLPASAQGGRSRQPEQRRSPLPDGAAGAAGAPAGPKPTAQTPPGVPTAAESAAPYGVLDHYLVDLDMMRRTYEEWAACTTGQRLLDEARELREETGVDDANEAGQIRKRLHTVLLVAVGIDTDPQELIASYEALASASTEAGRSLDRQLGFASVEDRRLLQRLIAQARAQAARLSTTPGAEGMLNGALQGVAPVQDLMKAVAALTNEATPAASIAATPDSEESAVQGVAPDGETAEAESTPGDGDVEDPVVTVESASEEAEEADLTAGADAEPDDGFDFWHDVIGDDLVVGGVVYSSSEWEPDGEGGVQRRQELDEMADALSEGTGAVTATTGADATPGGEEETHRPVDLPVGTDHGLSADSSPEEEPVARTATGTGESPSPEPQGTDRIQDAFRHEAAEQKKRFTEEAMTGGTPAERRKDDLDLHYETVRAMISGPKAAAQTSPSEIRSGGAGHDELDERYTELRGQLSLILGSIGAEPILEQASDQAEDAADAAALDAAMGAAQQEADSYWGTPEWEMIRQVSQAAQSLRVAVRTAVGEYAETTVRDIRVHGLSRAIQARTARAVSHAAFLLARRLDRGGRRDSSAWRAVWRLHRAATTRADRLTGLLPSGQRVDLADQLRGAWQWLAVRLPNREQTEAGEDAVPGRLRTLMARGFATIQQHYKAVTERIGDLARHPVWQRVTSAFESAREIFDKARLGVYRLAGSAATLGTGRMLWVRTVEMIAHGVRTLLDRLARNGGRDSLRWNALRVLHHAAEEHVSHLRGIRPEDARSPLGTYYDPDGMETDAPETTPDSPSTTSMAKPNADDRPKDPQEDERPPEVAEDADLLRNAVELVTTTNSVNQLTLQRRFRVGYQESGSLLKRMEELGIISTPTRGNRTVLMEPQEALRTVNRASSAQQAISHWASAHDPFRSQWFNDVRAALPREPQREGYPTRGEMISLLFHENTRVVRRQADREEAGQRANRAMELYLTGRGNEVPGMLAGEGYAYVRSPGGGWEAQESPVHDPAAGAAPEAPSLPQRRRAPESAIAAASPTNRTASPDAAPSVSQPSPGSAEDRARSTQRLLQTQAARLQDRGNLARAVATTPAEERKATLLYDLADKTKAAAQQLAASKSGGVKEPASGEVMAEPFLAALRAHAAARGAALPDDVVQSAWAAAVKATTAMRNQTAEPVGATTGTAPNGPQSKNRHVAPEQQHHRNGRAPSTPGMR